MTNDIDIITGKLGVKAIIKSEWREHYAKLLSDNNVIDIELNDAKGWNGKNIDFLNKFRNIISLTLIDLTIESIDAINNLNELRYLTLITYSKTKINFNNLPKLKALDFEYIKGSTSLFDLKYIEDLSLNRFNDRDFSSISKMNSLKALSMMNSRINNIKGICDLNNLISLSLINLSKITDGSCLSNLANLDQITLHRCKKINNISFLLSMKSVQKIHIIDMGSIDSINGIEKLANLREFLFYESTNIIDGNIRGLMQLPLLEKVAFQNRSHYSHKREDFNL